MRATLLSIAAVAAAGCNVAPRQDQSAAPWLLHDLIRARTAREFENSVFFKPREQSASGSAVEFAPIVVQELEAGALEPGSGQRIATWSSHQRGKRRMDASRASVYYDFSSALLNGRERRQITYAWRQARAADSAGGAWQAVRMTLDEDGFPQIWEVLSHPRLAVIYVSQSLERSAVRAFGSALPNRRFAIESSIDAHATVLVARVLSDGPVPMGPFVYQSREPGSITTLLCRCMPSQIAEVADGLWYELVPLRGTEEPLRDGGSATVPNSVYQLDVPLPDMHDPNWLERALRLPPDF